MTVPSTKPSERNWPALCLVLLALALLIYVIWRLDSAPRTDDAYVVADTIDVAPEVSGRIVELAVKDNQSVRKGDLLFRLDPRPFEIELARAQASLVALDKQIMLAQRAVTAQKYGADSSRAVVSRAQALVAQTTETLQRTQPLLSPGYVSAEEVDRARTAQRAAQADLTAAQLQAQQAASAVTGVDALLAQRDVVQADIALMSFRLEKATVRAPFDGRVVSLKTSVGQLASTLKPLFTLINTRSWYVVANFRETDLRNIQPGTPAAVYLMTDSNKRFKGVVDSIGYGVLPDDGGIVIEGLPRVTRTINWVRVAQRFPVKITVQNPAPELFRIGVSAMAELEPGRSAAHSQNKE